MSEDYINYNYKMPVNKGKINMKNIHLLSTDKPSRLHLGNSGLVLCDLNFGKNTINGQHIYITNDEYIGLSYYLDGNLVRKGVVDDKDYWEVRKDYKKIILTTNQDLIKAGVQAIDDEFLEWFVNNASCEEVEVKSFKSYSKDNYIMFIPQEEPKQCKCGSNWVNTTNKDNPFCFHCGKPLTQEPKQETLEEFIKSQPYYGYCTTEYKEGIEVGAKWQAERMYSEEDMFTFSQWISHEDWVYLPSKDYWVNEEQEELEQKLSSKEILNLWFEQFKKK